MKNEFKSFNPFESFVDKFGKEEESETPTWAVITIGVLFVVLVILAHFI